MKHALGNRSEETVADLYYQLSGSRENIFENPFLRLQNVVWSIEPLNHFYKGSKNKVDLMLTILLAGAKVKRSDFRSKSNNAMFKSLAVALLDQKALKPDNWNESSAYFRKIYNLLLDNERNKDGKDTYLGMFYELAEEKLISREQLLGKVNLMIEEFSESKEGDMATFDFKTLTKYILPKMTPPEIKNVCSRFSTASLFFLDNEGILKFRAFFKEKGYTFTPSQAFWGFLDPFRLIRAFFRSR